MPPRSTLNTGEFDLVLRSIDKMLDGQGWIDRGRQTCDCGVPARFNCTICEGPNFCRDCLIAAHLTSPFHDVKEWSNIASYFTRTLRDVGLRIPFGHQGADCAVGQVERLEAVTVYGEQLKTHGWVPMRSNFVVAM
ncbi:hypothetical protein C8F04DRAFT_1258193 [Mycena alexandri]|uniref:Uncharacterized protein n=1 Tax=Mycena alexandri TaxID=1745969 RepID=A0AAD6T1F4_9AGAR|nr:hypothetical protein C8F04DRAFT_1258193 [Mycena alexandri]